MILITGASSGIGSATARAFAKMGTPLLLVARRKERLEKLAKELSETFRVAVVPYALDVRSPKAIEAFAVSHATYLERVEILVNNAGLAKGLDPFQSSNPEHWEAMLDTNVKGLLYMTRAVLPHFLKAQRGHLINIGSVAGRWVYPKGHVYSATKRAVSALTEGLRLDLNGTGVRVTEIVPGMVETEFSEVRLDDKDKAKSVYKGVTPLSADDIAEAIVWCAIRPSHVNIQELVIYPTDQASPTVVNRKA